MYCGSCLRDNTLAATLKQMGHDVALIPTYTPIRTDEEDVSMDRVFYGGISVYLEERSRLFRILPRALTGLLDRPGILQIISRVGVDTDAGQLGGLTVSMLRGEKGHQHRELDQLVDFLAADFRPEIVYITNALLMGMAGEIRRRVKCPVLCGLQGEDIFINDLKEPFRSEVQALMRERARDIDGFVSVSANYADRMRAYLDVPTERIHVVNSGIQMAGHGEAALDDCDPPTIGYFARVCPAKGLHQLAEAFKILAASSEFPDCRLRAAGYLGKGDRSYLQAITDDLKKAGLADRFEYAGALDRQGKIAFLQSLSVFSVPTTYHECKGIYILEALANGVPVVQPEHGVFGDLIGATQGGLLVAPDDPAALAEGLRQVLSNTDLRRRLGSQGREVVHREYTAERMAVNAMKVYEQYAGQPSAEFAYG
jgi:glycosyltransferase involved in cell wall biosynthesis